MGGDSGPNESQTAGQVNWFTLARDGARAGRAASFDWLHPQAFAKVADLNPTLPSLC